MVTLTIPKQLAHHTKGKNNFTLTSTKLGDAIDEFVTEQNLAQVFYNSEGTLNQFIRFFVDNELVQAKNPDEFKNITLNENSQILIQTAFAGG